MRNVSSHGKVVVPSMCHTPGVRESYITVMGTMVTVLFVTYVAKPKKLLCFEDVINPMRIVISVRYHLRPKKYLSRRKHLSM
jgi:hypothetical protein